MTTTWYGCCAHLTVDHPCAQSTPPNPPSLHRRTVSPGFVRSPIPSTRIVTSLIYHSTPIRHTSIPRSIPSIPFRPLVSDQHSTTLAPCSVVTPWPSPESSGTERFRLDILSHSSKRSGKLDRLVDCDSARPGHKCERSHHLNSCGFDELTSTDVWSYSLVVNNLTFRLQPRPSTPPPIASRLTTLGIQYQSYVPFLRRLVAAADVLTPPPPSNIHIRLITSP